MEIIRSKRGSVESNPEFSDSSTPLNNKSIICCDSFFLPNSSNGISTLKSPSTSVLSTGYSSRSISSTSIIFFVSGTLYGEVSVSKSCSIGSIKKGLLSNNSLALSLLSVTKSSAKLLCSNSSL